MAKKQKYEVVEFNAGGFFIHGGSIGETYVKTKVDADLICEALNMVERLKLNSTKTRLSNLEYDIQQLLKAFSDGTESRY